MNIQETKLDNNLRVITNELPFLSGAVGAYVNVGSRSETEENNGVAHFLEHMAFKGTTNRTAYEISHQIEVLGSNINAMTNYDETAYYATGLACNAAAAADIIGDALTNSKYDAGDITLESGVILQEISQYEDDSQSTMYELLLATAYPNQPAGRTILGSKEFVRNAKPQDFRDFVDQNYSAETMVVFATGGIKHEEIVEVVSKSFSTVPATSPKAPLVPANYVGGLGMDTSKDFSQVAAGIMFPSVPVIDSSMYAHALLANALGGGMSSPLFTEVREKRGLVYHTSAYGSFDVDHGAFFLVGMMTPENLEEFIKVACGELVKMQETVNESDLERAKNTFLVSLALKQESPFRMMDYMAQQLFTWGRIRPLDEIQKCIESVTIDDLKTAAKRLLSGKPTVALVGPVPDADYEAMVASAL